VHAVTWRHAASLLLAFFLGSGGTALSNTVPRALCCLLPDQLIRREGLHQEWNAGLPGWRSLMALSSDLRQQQRRTSTYMQQEHHPATCFHETSLLYGPDLRVCDDVARCNLLTNG
jgi:hypothetical protein